MGKGARRPAGVERSVPGLSPQEMGPEADDPALTLDVWRDRIRRHPGELKNLLRNQAFVAGIGNAYSDEVLHAARLLPFRKRSALASGEVAAVYDGAAGGRCARRWWGRGARRGARAPRRACPADLRDAGARLPRGPYEGRAAVP